MSPSAFQGTVCVCVCVCVSVCVCEQPHFSGQPWGMLGVHPSSLLCRCSAYCVKTDVSPYSCERCLHHETCLYVDCRLGEEASLEIIACRHQAPQMSMLDTSRSSITHACCYWAAAFQQAPKIGCRSSGSGCMVQL